MTNLKLALISGVIISMIGCSADEQDDPTSNEIVPKQVNGVVIDPNIRGAVVFADYNDNGVVDTFEPWALTDDNGYFGTSKSGVNYCQQSSQYCLILPNNELVKLVAVDGYDSTTLERVNTRMSAMLSDKDLQTISPLTSLSTTVISEDFDQDLNFMAAPFGDENAISALQLAFGLHKQVEILSEVLNSEYSAIGDNELLPTDLSGFIYQAIDEVATAQSLDLDSFLQKNTQNNVDLILDNARTKLNQAYKTAGVSLFLNNAPSTYQQAPSQQRATSGELATLFVAFDAFLRLRFERALENDAIAELPYIQAGTLRQIQLVVNQTNAALAANNDINAAVLPIMDIFNVYEGNQLTDLFGQDTYDSGFWGGANTSSQIQIEQTLALMATRQALPVLVGNKTLTLQDKTAGRDAKIIFYFEGELAGDLTACVYYQDLSNPNNFNNSDGALFSGQWSKQNYQLFVTLNIAGTKQALRIKSGIGSNFVFDYDDREKDWDGLNSFEPTTGAIPTINTACKDNL